MMTPQEALRRADSIVVSAGYDVGSLNPDSFLQYARLVIDIVKHKWTPKRREKETWLKEFLETFTIMCGEYNEIVSKDPMVQYRPRNRASLDFHSSPAKYRHFRAGNRTSKTQSGYAEHYFYVTNSHPYKDIPQGAKNTFIIAGLPFTVYASKVFESKFITGEPGNFLSPMFPEGGKWFNHYDSRSRTITLACPECAVAGKAASCPGHHQKSRIFLFSSEGGIGVLEAFSGILGHIDEHVPKPYWTAMKQRLMSVDESCGIITGTPLHGPQSWEIADIDAIAEGPDNMNRMVLEDPKSRPLVTLHTCTQYEGNVVSKEETDAEARQMDRFEFEARIMGRPAPLADRPVFDRNKLEAIANRCLNPEYMTFALKKDVKIEELEERSQIYKVACAPENAAKFSGLRMWKDVDEKGQYLISVDTAAGLTNRDPNCANVLRITPSPDGYPHIEQVAQWWGWTSMLDYADELKKLGVYYNNAMIAIELSGGYGRGVLLRLKRQILYWNLFLDATKAELVEAMPEAKHGVDTNIQTKPLMVSSLQQAINNGLLDLYCHDTIRELNAFGQEETESGLSVRYRGMGDRDDRVMSLAIGTYVALTQPVYTFVDKGETNVDSDMDMIIAQQGVVNQWL